MSAEPVFSYPPDLPVSAVREEIAAAIASNRVVVIAGATGSGKTTQLPKICLELGRASIAHTQPRRIAARAIAERLCDEMKVPLGGVVGYRVRFTDKASADTRLTLMTDGILLNEIHRDPDLRRYDTIIVDEAHERSLNVDVLLGYLTRLLRRRDDLTVIITSATIDVERFADHFRDAAGNPAPVIEVSGRAYPVEIRYRPAQDKDADDVDGIVAALRELDGEKEGDVLVFLPGESEIRDAMDAVRGLYAGDAKPTEVLPLYGRLSAAEQHRVFEPSRVAGLRRRVILATNVAETSLTVPGIRYVVDTGTARISRYSTRAAVQRLPIEAISQASAQQRSGRAGRTAPGIAIRLYAEEDFAARPEFTEPEILRTSLASVTLQLLSLGFGDLATFPFLTPPDSRGVKAAMDLLTELGAVRRDRRDQVSVTKVGRQMVRLPIDPRFARMLLEANDKHVLGSVLPIVAGLSIVDVRERPEAAREEADRSHARFTDPTSDFITLLNLWNYLGDQRRTLGSSAFRRLCRAEYLNYVRVREWFDVHRQVSSLMGAKPSKGTDAPDTVHKALLAGLLSHIGLRDERSMASAGGKRRPQAEYHGARGARFAIFPGSGLRKRQPAAVMAAELVETSRLFARTVAAIDPAWAEPLAGDLAVRKLSEPHWSQKSGAASAYEKVTLFGVEIVPRRRVHLSRFDRPLARELFLRHALVQGEWDPNRLSASLTGFWSRNQKLRERLEEREERERRRDILAGDETIYRFYDQRIPSEVVDSRSFETWLKKTLPDNPAILDLSEADLAAEGQHDGGTDFPGQWRQGDQVLALRYRFEPGSEDDGTTVIVPLALLSSLRDTGFDWHVPGMRDEVITALLRSLPKPIRRHVVPAADWAAKLATAVAEAAPEHHDGFPPETLTDALAQHVRRVASQPVTRDDFDDERIPRHLRMAFEVVDDAGVVRDRDVELTALQRRLADTARDTVARATTEVPGNTVERDGITEWGELELAEVVDTPVAGGVVRGYPSVVDEKTSVALRVQTDATTAARLTRAGVRRLLLLSDPSPATYVLDHITADEKLALAASPYPSARALVEDCRAALADAAITAVMGSRTVRTPTDFEAVRAEFARGAVDGLFELVSLSARILIAAREVDRAIAEQNSLTLLAALQDLRDQRAGLVFDGFISRTGRDRLTQLPRYLRGMQVRLTALPNNPGRDRQWQTEYERAHTLFVEAGGTIPPAPDAPEHIIRTRWLLEEYRISLFAQAVGTAEPVSLQRITKALREP